mgnify:CR=1 FL=1
MKIQDIHTGISPICGFSIKSHIGSKPTLINAGENTNFIFNIIGCNDEIMSVVNGIESKTKNMGAYLRKMAIDGYIVNTDTTPLKKQYEEMHKIGVNINQIAKKVNSTGDLYSEEMQELKEMVKEFWRILRSSPLK